MALGLILKDIKKKDNFITQIKKIKIQYKKHNNNNRKLDNYIIRGKFIATHE